MNVTALGVTFTIAAVIPLTLLLWCAWIRRQYAFWGWRHVAVTRELTGFVWVLAVCEG